MFLWRTGPAGLGLRRLVLMWTALIQLIERFMAAAAAELGVGGVNRGVDLLASVCLVRLPTTRPAALLLLTIFNSIKSNRVSLNGINRNNIDIVDTSRIKFINIIKMILITY